MVKRKVLVAVALLIACLPSPGHCLPTETTGSNAVNSNAMSHTADTTTTATANHPPTTTTNKNNPTASLKEQVAKLSAMTHASSSTIATTSASGLASGAISNEPSKFVYTTLVFSDNDYVKGCVMLGKSLALSGTSYPRVLLSLTDLSSASTKALKETGGWQIRRIKPIRTPFPDKCGRFCDMYGKLRVWEALTDFDAALYLDSDMYVAQNIDNMFEKYKVQENEIAAVADSKAPHINGGMFLFRPSQTIFNDMLKKMGKIEFSVIRHSYSSEFAYEYTEQSFLHAYFRPCLFTETCESTRLHVLENKYNCQLHTQACRTQFEQQQQDTNNNKNNNNNNNADGVAVFHYTSQPKPWACGEGLACCGTSEKTLWPTSMWKKTQMCASKTYTHAFELWASAWRTSGLASKAFSNTQSNNKENKIKEVDNRMTQEVMNRKASTVNSNRASSPPVPPTPVLLAGSSLRKQVEVANAPAQTKATTTSTIPTTTTTTTQPSY